MDSECHLIRVISGAPSGASESVMADMRSITNAAVSIVHDVFDEGMTGYDPIGLEVLVRELIAAGLVDEGALATVGAGCPKCPLCREIASRFSSREVGA